MKVCKVLVAVSIVSLTAQPALLIAQPAGENIDTERATDVEVVNRPNNPVPVDIRRQSGAVDVLVTGQPVRVEVANPTGPASDVTVVNPEGEPVPVKVTNPGGPVSEVTINNPGNQPVPVNVTNAGNQPVSVAVTNAENLPLPVRIISGGQLSQVMVTNDTSSAVPVNLTNNAVTAEVPSGVNVNSIPAITVDQMPSVDIASMPPVTVNVDPGPLPPWAKVGGRFPNEGKLTILDVRGLWLKLRRPGEGQIPIPVEFWIYLPTGKCYGDERARVCQ